MFRKIMSTGNSAAFLFLRLALGIVMLAHGLQQTIVGFLGGTGINSKLDYYATFGVPKFIGFCGIMSISVGAILLILGICGRVWAFFIGAFLVTAMFLGGHLHNGILMNWEGHNAGEGYEFHILGIGIAIAILIYGSGAFSLDRLFMKREH